MAGLFTGRLCGTCSQHRYVPAKEMLIAVPQWFLEGGKESAGSVSPLK
jgi:hypothetical protein